MDKRITKYLPAHAYELFEQQIQESNFMLSSIGDFEKIANQWYTTGPGVTLLIDDKPVASGGIALVDETFGECWGFIPKTEHGMILIGEIYKVFDQWISEHKFRRLQSFVLEGFETGVKMVERLGFEREGLLRNYGPSGENVWIYGRIF